MTGSEPLREQASLLPPPLFSSILLSDPHLLIFLPSLTLLILSLGSFCSPFIHSIQPYKDMHMFQAYQKLHLQIILP